RATSDLSNAAGRYETAGAESEKLTISMRGASDRFFQLDASLAKVFEELKKGLGGFTQEVTRCVKETDGQLAKAVTHLHGLVEDLKVTVEDKRPTRVGERR